jgi:hypothetical protein
MCKQQQKGKQQYSLYLVSCAESKHVLWVRCGECGLEGGEERVVILSDDFHGGSGGGFGFVPGIFWCSRCR